MSRVLARKMFKNKAPKRSAKGTGITSMLEDDVPGFAEGGEVEVDDRAEREKIARELLARNRDEGEGYQRFSAEERPRMTRLPATAGMAAPPPNPQAMQAMQMQRMAQMGMLPRFSRGGVASKFDAPNSGIPIFDPGTGGFSAPVEMSSPTIAYTPEPIIFDGREPPAQITPYVPKTPAGRALYSGIAATPERIAAVEKAQELESRRAAIEAAREANPVPGWFSEVTDEERAAARARQEAAIRDTIPAPSEAKQAAMEAGREARRAAGLSSLPFAPTPKEQKREESGGGDSGTREKKTDLPDIKAERAAKAEAARRENVWLAMMQAGLAIAGGKSSNAITNIGQGGQAGLASFMALEQQRRRDEDAAERRDLAEREYGLQVRRQKMQEPYYQAQTEYLKMRPEIAAAQLQLQRDKMLLLAQDQAQQKVYDEVKANPMAYTKKDGTRDELKIQAEISKRTQQIILRRQLGNTEGSGGFGRLGLDLPAPSDSGE